MFAAYFVFLLFRTVANRTSLTRTVDGPRMPWTRPPRKKETQSTRAHDPGEGEVPSMSRRPGRSPMVPHRSATVPLPRRHAWPAPLNGTYEHLRWREDHLKQLISYVCSSEFLVERRASKAAALFCLPLRFFGGEKSIGGGCLVLLF